MLDILFDYAARLAQLGIAVVVFDPAANRPAAGDYLQLMSANAANLEGLR